MTDDFKVEKKQPSHIAFTFTEYKGHTNWYKIGKAYRTDKDDVFVNLAATPVDGNLFLRRFEEVEKLREQRNAQVQEKGQDHTISP